METDPARAAAAMHEAIAAYYGVGSVRQRIEEYCRSAAGVAGYGGMAHLWESDGAPVNFAPDELPELLSLGSDVSRSLVDLDGTLVHIDIDYTNPGDPAEPYREAALCFERLEPVYQALRDAFDAYGLAPIALMTGRGYHFTARAREGGAFQRELLRLGRIGAELRASYETLEPFLPDAVRRGQAHDGAGRIVEHLAHRVTARLEGKTALPVTMADVPPPGQGAFACLDLSPYGDPLHRRTIRSAFSANQKAGAGGIVEVLPYVICLPRQAEALDKLLRWRAEPALAAAFASGASACIPDIPDEALAWIDEYRAGALFRFHESYLAEGPCEREPPRVDLLSLPPCAALPLLYPYPALLQPARLRVVVYVLEDRGFTAAEIAAVVASRFREAEGFGDNWERYDPATRAAFYVRLLAGLRADGLVAGADFTCATEGPRGVCPDPGCGHTLGLADVPRQEVVV